MARRRGRARLLTPEPIRDIVQRVERVDGYPERPRVDEALWVLVAGKAIAARTRPLKLDPDGTLLVRTASAAWSQELSLLEPELRGRLASAGVPVSRLRFQVGRLAPLRTPVELAREVRALPPQPLPVEVVVALESVESDELREAIVRACARRLG